MSKLVSIFDGWTKKIEHLDTDRQGGFCAQGWIIQQRLGLAAYGSVMNRVGSWIQANLDPPKFYIHKCSGAVLEPLKVATAAVVWANNECKLDIDGFKMVDLLTQGYIPEEESADVDAHLGAVAEKI